jgi:hypothetical protein
MQFLKTNYEKVLLSIVLLGLAIAAATLPLQVANVRAELEETRRTLTVRVKPKPFQPADEWLANSRQTVARLQTPLDLELAGGHNLFNPVPWRRVDNRLIPIRDDSYFGPGAVKITQIRDLFLTVALDGIDQSEPPRYRVSVLNETDSNPRPDTRTVSTASPRNNLIELVGVEGPPAEPDALVLKVRGFDHAIRVAPGQKFQRVVGHAADLTYENTRQTWSNQRVGRTIRLNDQGENYKIVAIKHNEVVLESPAKKKTTLKHDATSTTASIQ